MCSDKQYLILLSCQVYYVLLDLMEVLISGAIEFIETPIFTKLAEKLFTDDEIRNLQTELIQNPAKGVLIQNTGGLRKIRVATGEKGKSGGSRVIYLLAHKELIYFVLAYPKSKKDTLTDSEKAELRKLTKILKEEN